MIALSYVPAQLGEKDRELPRSLERSSRKIPKNLFYVCYRRKMDLPYRGAPVNKDDWLRLRHEEALTIEAIIRLVKSTHSHCGFNDSSWRGAC